ncbi:DUF5819 family protein [Streptomyces sp. DSM 44917]|uniref:DUF5819 family protein n=1 Tax=Streptomyces boetiae TaxID=3075541 RepID=A0ABU2L8R1_9ACTN|nr:DUF5819 family protein [Streptomyces sp. DSM 44917]MDT0307960.1 DUF5819 family protein [Streptomyces sp. DSM 44917]
MKPPEARGQAASAQTGEPRFSALSPPTQAIIAVVAATMALAAVVHMAVAIFYVAPSENTVMDQYGEEIREYVTPEFTRNWQLFAPDPTQVNVHLQARARVRADNGVETTGWIDLSARNHDEMRHNLLPSKTMNTQLRRAWSFYQGSHDEEGNPETAGAPVAEIYLHRIALERLGEDFGSDSIERIQLRLQTTRPDPPPWTDRQGNDTPTYQVLEWWAPDSGARIEEATS